MVIDFHTHIFPKDIRENRTRYFPGEPAFQLLYDSPKSQLVGTEDLLAAMDAQGIDMSVIFGFPWKNIETSRHQNDYVLESVARYPNRLIGMCCLDPSNNGSDVETARCLSSGLSGLGELAFYESGIDEDALDHLAPLMDICRGHDVPVLIHTNEPIGHLYPGKSPNTLIQIYRLVRRFSGNRIVLAHWGGGIFLYMLLKKEIKESLQNVWFDTAASPFLYTAEIWRYAASLVGAEKILFGTDFPLLQPERYFRELENSGLPESEIKKIIGENAATLLKITQRT